MPARMRSITSLNSSGRPLGVPSSSRTCRCTTVAPGRARLDARLGDLLGRVRDVGVVLAEHVGPGHRDREHDRVAVPSAHSRATSSPSSDARSLVGDRSRAALLGVPEHEPELGLDDDLAGVVEDALARGHARAARARARRSRTVTASRPGRSRAWKLTEQRPTTYSSRADAVVPQEGVAPLLEVGEDDACG